MGWREPGSSFEDQDAIAQRFDEAIAQFWKGEGSQLFDLIEQTEDREETLFRVLQPDFRPVETLQPGTRIDDYVIQRKVGIGGMGIVFEALEDRTSRPVALKISRFQRRDSEHRDRALQREMKALSKLIHPNIATLYRAGYFEKKYTFLAMEFVSGKNLRLFIRERAFGLREVLRLFLQLLEAVAFIQSKGILHLDLKPSNILVDRDGRVKLLDFGLSKLQDLGRETKVPNPEETWGRGEKLNGTLPYLAPEQIESEAQTSTRTDVYQLGVILYEILLGRKPFPWRDVRRLEVTRRITEGSFCKPRELQKGFPLDLELIILKSMAKNPMERYSGAAGFKKDLESYLSGFPVSAKEPTLFDFFGKFLKRNQRMALFFLFLFVLFGVLAGFSVDSYYRERRARERAVGLERSVKITTDAIENLGPAGSPGRAKVMAAALAGIGNALDQDVRRGDLPPEQEARLRAMLGRHYTKIGFHKKALPQLERALSLRRKLFGVKPHKDLAQSLRDLAFLHHAMSSFEKSEPLHREALAMRLGLFPEASRLVCQSKEELAELLVARGRPEEALGLLRKGLFQLEQSPGGGPFFLRQLRNLARLTLDQGDSVKALDLLKRGRAYLERNPQDVSEKDRFYFLRVLIKALCVSGKAKEAIAVFERVEPLCKSIFGGESEQFAQLLGLRAMFSFPKVKGGKSLNKARQAVELGIKIYGRKHAITLSLRMNLFRQLILLGFLEEGKEKLLALLEDYQAKNGVGKADRNRFFLTASSSFLDLGELKKASKLLSQVRPFFLRDGVVDIPSRIFYHECQARALYQASQYSEALAEGERGLVLVRRLKAPRLSIGLLGGMSLIHKAMEHPQEAKAFLERQKTLCLRFGLPISSLSSWRAKPTQK
jgi:serine/threonine-protein kinase